MSLVIESRASDSDGRDGHGTSPGRKKSPAGSPGSSLSNGGKGPKKSPAESHGSSLIDRGKGPKKSPAESHGSSLSDRGKGPKKSPAGSSLSDRGKASEEEALDGFDDELANYEYVQDLIADYDYGQGSRYPKKKNRKKKNRKKKNKSWK